MSAPLLDSLFKQAVKGCSLQVNLVSNQKSGHCTFATGMLIYHEGFNLPEGRPFLARFSTADNPPLKELFSDGMDPHTDPPQPLPQPFDPRQAAHYLGLTIIADGTVNIYSENQTKNILTFAAQESLDQVIYGIALSPSSSSNPVFTILENQAAPFFVISFGKIIPPIPPPQ